MGCNKIITINRQYCSGGHDIGQALAKKLEIPFYDKELISIAAKQSGVSPEIFEQIDEKATNSLLYSLSMGIGNFGGGFSTINNLPINDKLYILQHKIIKDLADKETFVVVGRCADYVLREHDNVVKVYIYADYERRVERAVERHDLTEQKAKQMVTKVDKSRANYYSFYSGEKWGLVDNYDLCINSTNLSVEQAVDIILSYINVINNK